MDMIESTTARVDISGRFQHGGKCAHLVTGSLHESNPSLCSSEYIPFKLYIITPTRIWWNTRGRAIAVSPSCCEMSTLEEVIDQVGPILARRQGGGCLRRRQLLIVETSRVVDSRCVFLRSLFLRFCFFMLSPFS